MYLLTKKTITSDPPGNSHAPGGYYRLLMIFTLLSAIAGCTPGRAKDLTVCDVARERIDQGQYTQAVEILTDYLKKNMIDRRQAGEAYYLRGLCYRHMRPALNESAQKDFEKAVKKTRDFQIQALASAELGHIYYEDTPADYELAIRCYRNALAQLSKAPPMDSVLFRLGVSLQRQGNWPAADLYLSRCFNQFPESPWAQRARSRLGGRTFRVQIGKYDSLGQARRMVDQLKESGRPARWTAIRKGKTLRYVVQMGKYASYLEAEKARKNVMTKYANAFILVTPLAGNEL